MIDAKHVHKLLECKYDFKHWIKDVISSFNFKDGIDYISYRYDNNGEQIIDNNSHVFRHDYYLFPKMYYSDGFPKVFKCENELVKATLMYLDDPDAPEGVAFIRWLAVQDYLGEKINWKDLT